MSRSATPEEIRLWRAVMAIKPSPAQRTAVPAPRSTLLDLHGYSVHEAYQTTIGFLRSLAAGGGRSGTIVTGRSGQIKQEFARWVEPLPFIAACDEVPGGGAYCVKLKRTRAFPP